MTTIRATGTSTSATSPRSDARRPLESIQYMRGLAAVMVVLAHASSSLLEHQRPLINLQVGGYGVDLFFVISGFIMFYTTDGRGLTRTAFYRKRLMRIMPLYFLLTTLAFVLAFVMPHSFHTLTARPADYLRSILFIPFFNTVVQGIRPEIGQGWTLNYEMFFYLLFGLCLPMARTLRLVFCAVGLSALVLVGCVIHPANPLLHAYTDPLLLEFLLGMVLGYSARNVRLRAWLAMGLIVSAVSLLGLEMLSGPLSLPRFLMVGIPAAAVLSAALWLEGRGGMPHMSWLLLLGDSSYSLYLTHGFVLALLRRVWLSRFDSHRVETHLAYFAATLVLSVPTGILIYRMVELPAGEAMMWCWKQIAGVSSLRKNVLRVTVTPAVEVSEA
jgi:exopolysaccharide production protein ExoZ